jgi:hypothetical protein
MTWISHPLGQINFNIGVQRFTESFYFIQSVIDSLSFLIKDALFQMDSVLLRTSRNRKFCPIHPEEHQKLYL